MTDQQQVVGYQGPGRYQHYKGNMYEVIGLAIREETANTGQVKEVIYKPLSPGSMLEQISDVEHWSRMLDDFNQEVELRGDGGPTRVPRFVKVGEG